MRTVLSKKIGVSTSRRKIPQEYRIILQDFSSLEREDLLRWLGKEMEKEEACERIGLMRT